MNVLADFPWVACSEILPDLRQLVMLAAADGRVFPGARRPAGRGGNGWAWAPWGWNSAIPRDAVTHWGPMPLHPARMAA